MTGNYWIELRDSGGNPNSTRLSEICAFASNGGRRNLEEFLKNGKMLRFEFDYDEFRRLIQRKEGYE